MKLRPITAFIAGAAVALSACGGGGGSSPSPSPIKATIPATAPQPIAAADYHPTMSAAWLATPGALRILHIAMYGDSTIFGCTDYIPNVCTQNPGDEPAALQAMFDRDFGPGRVVVENHGVGGTTCQELLSGAYPENNLGWLSEMANTDAQIVTVNDEINDGESDAAFTYCYQTIAGIALGYNRAFIIEGPNPTSLPGTLPAHQPANVQDEIAVSYQAGTPYIDTYDDTFTFYPQWCEHEPDGVHPDADFYWFKASMTYATLKPIAVWMMGVQ